MMFIAHCATAVMATTTPITTRQRRICAKSTRPASTMKSMASPTTMGTYSVSATDSAASSRLTATSRR